MRNPLESIRQLIAHDQLKRALDDSSALLERLDSEQRAEVIALRARTEQAQRQTRRGLISSEQEAVEKNRIRFALLSILDELKATPAADEDRGPASQTSVFISYSHADRPVMARLERALSERGIEVWTDLTKLAAGESIPDFIPRAIRKTGATLSIVSSASLLSDWVALETLHTFAAELFTSKRRFIAGYLDERFLNPAFRMDATTSLDQRLTELDRLAFLHRERQLDTQDLESQRGRLIRLRNGLGEILQRLRESLTVDLRGQEFENAVERICATIKSARRQDTS